MNNSTHCLDAALYQSKMEELKFSREKVFSDFSQKPVYTKELDPPSQEKIDDEVRLLIDNLPTTYSGTILVRQNSKSPRIFSALMFGAEGTPYDNACILFDVYLPNKYPQVPLEIKCKVDSPFGQMNPNIITNGKLFLSLLDTYGADSGYGKWNPKDSSIFQVLFCIQSLVFVEEPYFNDSYKENQRDTPWGKNESQKYNQRTRLIITVECIHKMLINPPPEFKTAIQYHFLLKRDYIKKVLYEWKILVDEKACNTNSYMATEYISYKKKTLSEWIDEIIVLLDSLKDTSYAEQENDDSESSAQTVKLNSDNDFDFYQDLEECQELDWDNDDTLFPLHTNTNLMYNH